VADERTAGNETSGRAGRRTGQTKSPPAPGAAASPQMPGQVPDRSTVPGHVGERVPRVVRPIRRPLTEYGTAQEIMHVFPAPDEEPQPAEFEQATASVEELRKAYPWQLPPTGPTPVFALDQGIAPEPPALPGSAPQAPELGAGQERG
jgi:hypothetical protein